jgi:hypothetical protein
MTYRDPVPQSVQFPVRGGDDPHAIKRHGADGDRRKETTVFGSMTLYADSALVIANSRINDLRAQADAERLARNGRRPGRLATLVATVRATLNVPAVDRPVVPLLSEYPYRS